MGDRAAKRALLGALGVDVDPLIVTGDLGELVNLLLGNEMPVADARSSPMWALISSSPVRVSMLVVLSSMTGPTMLSTRHSGDVALSLGYTPGEHVIERRKGTQRKANWCADEGEAECGDVVTLTDRVATDQGLQLLL